MTNEETMDEFDAMVKDNPDVFFFPLGRELLAADRAEGERRALAELGKEQLKMAPVHEQLAGLRATLEGEREKQRRLHPPQGSIDAAIRAAVRDEIRAEARSALADHRAQEREREGTRLVPLVERAAQLHISTKALRARIERGSVPGATKVGGRWHVPVGTL